MLDQKNRIGILEDDLAFRKSLEDFFNASANFEIVFSHGAYLDVKSKKIDYLPDFILLDIHLSDVMAVEIVENLKIKFPLSHIILMTGDQDKSLLIQAIERGGSSYLIKPFKLNVLLTTIYELQKNGSYLPLNLLADLMNQLVIRQKSKMLIQNITLTDREDQMLLLIVLGLTYKEISTRLIISYHTVNYHIKSIYAKYDVNSKIGLIRKIQKIEIFKK